MALLPTKQRDQAMVLVVLVAAGLIYGYWNYVWSPKQEALSALGERVETMETANAKAKVELAKGNTERLRGEADRAAAELTVLRRLVPVGTEVPSLLDQVSTAARRVGLDLAAVEPVPVVEGATFDTYRYRITVVGGYHALGAFLANVGSLSRIVAPTNLTLGPAAAQIEGAQLRRGQQMLDARLEIQTYVAKTGARPAPAPTGGSQS